MTDVTDHVSPARGASLLEARGMRLRELAAKADEQAEARPQPATLDEGPTGTAAATAVADALADVPERSRRPRAVLLAAGVAAALAVGAVVGLGAVRGAEPEPVAAPVVPVSVLPSVAPVDAHAAFCAAARQVRMDDLAVLSQHVVEQPIQTEAAYRDLYTYAPIEIAGDLAAQRPIVERVIAASHAGAITTTGAFKDLITQAPPTESTAWVLAQGRIVPVIARTC